MSLTPAPDGAVSVRSPQRSLAWDVGMYPEGPFLIEGPEGIRSTSLSRLCSRDRPPGVAWRAFNLSSNHIEMWFVGSSPGACSSAG